MKKDDLGNTALLCAVENRHFTVAAYLAELSPWHAVNKAGRTFLKAVDVVNCHGSDNTDAKKAIQILAFKVKTSILSAESNVYQPPLLSMA